MYAYSHTLHKSMLLNMGPVLLELPLEIIKSISFKAEDQYHAHATVTLGDGSVVEGRTWGDESFHGQTNLGTFSVEPSGLTSVSFAHKAEATSTFVPRGKHSAVVHTKDGGQIVLTGAAFVRDIYAGNPGCFDHTEPGDTFQFRTGDAEYGIEWNKVAAIVLGDRNIDYLGWNCAVTLRDGQTKKGVLLGSDPRIEGAASYGGSYKLQTTVWVEPQINSWAKLEFRD